jgi:hypothetical protein
MYEQESISRLLFELKSAAGDYRSENERSAAPEDKSLPALLARRCERFATEIEKAFGASHGFSNGVAREPAQTMQTTEKNKAREQFFVRIEGRESRLERLYRETLRDDRLSTNVRGLLKSQLRAVSEWHNFVIAEEVNLIFGSELKIPSELNEI